MPDDHDRASRVLSALLADRPEQQSGKAAVPARSDDEQIGVAGFVDQHCCGGALDDVALDLDSVRVWHDVVQRGVEGERSGVAQLADVAADDWREALQAGDADVAELPGVNDAKSRLSELRLSERKAERLLSPGRAVNTNDDKDACLILRSLVSSFSASKPTLLLLQGGCDGVSKRRAEGRNRPGGRARRVGSSGRSVRVRCSRHDSSRRRGCLDRVADEEVRSGTAEGEEAAGDCSTGEKLDALDQDRARGARSAPCEQRRDREEQLVGEPGLDERAEQHRSALAEDQLVAARPKRLNGGGEVKLWRVADRNDRGPRNAPAEPGEALLASQDD